MNLKINLGIIALLICNLLAHGSKHVQVNYVGLENNVPNSWTTNNGAALSMSNAHYKLGSQSVQWDWLKNSSINITNPPNIINAVTTYKGGMMLWIYNDKAIDSKITFEFGKGSTANYTFQFGINYTGWRACWITFKGDMTVLNLSDDLDYMKITAPSNVDSGSLFFDRLSFPSQRVHDRITPDAQLPFVNPSMAHNHWGALWHWQTQYKHDIALSSSLSAKELSDLELIDKRILAAYKAKMPTSAFISKYKKKYKKFNISLNNGVYTGKNYVSDDEYDAALGDMKMKEVGDVLYGLAKIYYHKKDSEAKTMFMNLLGHVMEQGLCFGSGMGTNHHYGYAFRNFPQAIFLMKDVLKKENKLKPVCEMLNYWAGVPEYRLAPVIGTLQGLMDTWNTTIIPRLVAVCAMENTPEKAREMKAVKRWMDGSLEIVPGSMGGIKADGSGYHHGGLYPAYSSAAYAGVGSFLKYLNNTDYVLSKKARKNFGMALVCMKNYSNKRDWGVAIAGRHPFEGSISSGAVKAFAFLAYAGDPYSNDKIWGDMASAYIRLEDNPTGFKKDFIKKGFKAEENPEGSFSYNYGGLGIYRRDNYMVTMKAYNKHIWGSEIYTKDNRYGRYLSYGTVQVIGGDNASSSHESGFEEEGWDWNRFPGSTNIHLPLNLLDSPLAGTLMEKSDETFGGASNINGESGIFAINLHEGNRKNFTSDHRARKSVFTFGDKVICLGSNISNSNYTYNTETTLFQSALKSTSKAIYIDNTKGITDFPYNNSLDLYRDHWLMDPVGNAYWTKKGTEIIVKRNSQDSRENRFKKPTKGNFASAWINHGISPFNKDYEYVVLPNSSVQKVQAFAQEMSDNSTVAYKVLEQDDSAHIVWDRETNTTGFAFFEKNDKVDHSIVSSVSVASLVMLKENAKNVFDLSVCNPDLNYSSVNYVSDEASRESILNITLDGNWDVLETSATCNVISKDDKSIKLQFILKDGIKQQLKLKKVNEMQYEDIMTESFESPESSDTYTLKGSFDSSNKLYFGRYDINAVNKYYLNNSYLKGVDQNFFIAGASVNYGLITEDAEINFADKKISNYKKLKLEVSLGAIANPVNKFDAKSDFLIIEYTTGNKATYKTLAAFYGTDIASHPYKGSMGIDRNLDGISDGKIEKTDYITAGKMSDFAFFIEEPNIKNIKLRIRISNNHYYEGIYVDNVRLSRGTTKDMVLSSVPKLKSITSSFSNNQSGTISFSANTDGKVYWSLTNSDVIGLTHDDIVNGIDAVDYSDFEYSVDESNMPLEIDNIQEGNTYRINAYIANVNGDKSQIFTSKDISALTTSVNNMLVDNKMNLTVNNSILYLDFQEFVDGNVYVDIYNVSGVLLANNVFADSYSFSMNLPSEGLLIIKVKTHNNTYTQKIVNTIF